VKSSFFRISGIRIDCVSMRTALRP
jgi:hypothetical protein